MPWIVTAISSDRRSIDVEYVAGDGYCTKPVGFRVEKIESTVTVTALSRPNGDSACGNSLALARATIALPNALITGMTLLHAPVAMAWDNPRFFG